MVWSRFKSCFKPMPENSGKQNWSLTFHDQMRVFLATQGAVDFGEYLDNVDLLVISKNFHEGAGADVLDAAQRAWTRLFDTWSNSWEAHSRQFFAMPWSGPAREEMIQVCMKYVDWLHETLEPIEKIRCSIHGLQFSYRKACGEIATPQEIEKNRRKIKLLLRKNVVLTERRDWAIAALDTEYIEWREKSKAAVWHYYQIASWIATDLVMFTKVPELCLWDNLVMLTKVPELGLWDSDFVMVRANADADFEEIELESSPPKDRRKQRPQCPVS